MKKLKYIKILVLLAMAFFILVTIKNIIKPVPRTIIILNGPSSSGKSSIAKELENKLFDKYLKIGADEFILMLLPKKLYNFNPEEKQPTDLQALRFIKTDDDKGPKLIAKVGESALNVFCDMPIVIKALLNNGYNMIVDAGITANLNWLNCFMKNLQSFKVYFIKITAPLSVLEQREKQRNGFVGLSRGQVESMQENEEKYNIMFDLALDTSNLNPEEAADKIIKFIETHNNPQAFKQIQKINI